MLIGFGAPVAGAWATPLYLGSFAERAEALGYASLWSFQRLLVPEGSGMEPVYRSVLDPMVALGFLAARTSRIRLGVATICLPYVSPAVLAKQATTVDVLSGGRLDLGLGIGWMPEEFVATGASTARRGARAEEFLAVLRTLWADEVSSFSGEFYTIPAGRQDPRPVQQHRRPWLLHRPGVLPPGRDRVELAAERADLIGPQGAEHRHELLGPRVDGPARRTPPASSRCRGPGPAGRRTARPPWWPAWPARRERRTAG